MAYRMLQSGVVECDTADEAKALLGPSTPARPVKKQPKPGVAKSWEQARKAVKPGESVADARKRLAADAKAPAKKPAPVPRKKVPKK